MTESLVPQLQPSEKISIFTHSTFWLCGVMVIGFTIWSSISTLDIVSIAIGQVTPSTQVKTIQHLEGGIVREIMVSEGQVVKAGQALVDLEPTVSGADVAELGVRLRSLESDIAQLEALGNGLLTAVFPERLKIDYPYLAKNAQKRFETRKNHHENQLRKQEQAIIQGRLEINEILTQINGSRNSLKLVDEQIRISEDLLKVNLTSRFLHLDLLKERRLLRSSEDTGLASLALAKSALSESEMELSLIRSAFEDDIQKSLEEARLNHGEFKQRIKKFEDSLKRTVVRSPEDGVIKTLHVITVGGVLSPGDPIADIVPVGDRLIIEARLSVQDIGYVIIGQTAVVKLASANATRFDSLNGSVVNVSPDTLITPEGEPFYKIRVKLEKSYFENGELRYPLLPGMEVITSIRTGERTVLQYILDPILYRLGGAFQER